MADDRLRMTAELVDQISGRLKTIKNNLRDFGKEADKAPSPWLKLRKPVSDAQERLRHFGKEGGALRREFRAIQETIGRVTPAFGKLTGEVGALTIGAGSLVGTMAALGAATITTGVGLAKFSRSMVELKFLSRTTGETAVNLKEFERLAERFSIAPEAMDQAMANFANQFEHFKTRSGELYEYLQKVPHEIWDKLWQADTAEKGFKALLEMFDTVRERWKGYHGEVRAAEIAAVATGNANLARLTHIREELDKIDLKFPKEDFKAAYDEAQKFHETISDTRAIFDDWETMMEARLLPSFNKMVEEFNTWATGDGIKFVQGAFKDMSDTIEAIKAGIKWLDDHVPAWLLPRPGSGAGGTGPVPGSLADRAKNFLAQPFGPNSLEYLATGKPPTFSTDDVRRTVGLPEQTGLLDRLKKAFGFQHGGEVPRDMWGFLHKGEQVIPAHMAQGGAPSFGRTGLDMLRAGDAEIAIEQRRVWSEYWKLFHRSGIELLQGGGGSAGVGGGAAGSGTAGGGGGAGSSGGADAGGPVGEPAPHLMPASYSPNAGGGGLGPGSSAGGFGGGRFGGGIGALLGAGRQRGLPRLHGGGLPRKYRFGFGDGGGSSAGGSGHVAPRDGGALSAAPNLSGLGGNAFIRSQRSRFAEELRNPNARLQFAAMLLSEDAKNPVPVAESAMNRSLYKNTSLQRMLHSGFYGPINRGQLPRFMRQLQNNPKLMTRMNAAIDRVLAGSDVIKGFTDQGLPTDPGARYEMAHEHMMLGGEVFGDWGGGPGGHRGAAAWRRQFEAQAAAAARQATNSTMRHEVGGNVGIDIAYSGPPGMRVNAKPSGIFKRVRMNRSVQMQPAAAGPADIPH